MTSATRHRPDGVLSAGGILDRIVDAKAARLREVNQRQSLADLMAFGERVGCRPQTFSDSLTRPGRINVIAELKHRSPSKGIIRLDYQPAVLALSYERAGAAAISVLCEEDFFGGSLDHLREIGSRVDVALLRKDFIFDEYQLYEARAAGADAVLLIVAILDDGLLNRLIGRAAEVGLDALVEVHTSDEMRRAADAGARIIGVNNRDLTTFRVDLRTSLDLAELAPPGSVLVSESGIASGSDIRRLASAGYRAFLIGERLMTAVDPGRALEQLIAEAENESSQS